VRGTADDGRTILISSARSSRKILLAIARPRRLGKRASLSRLRNVFPMTNLVRQRAMQRRFLDFAILLAGLAALSSTVLVLNHIF
jgi:hypothetical protein